MLDRLVSDWPLKILALLLAFSIWVSITGEKIIVRNFEVALAPQLREDRIFTIPPPTAVTVRLRGPDSVVRKLDPLVMTVRLDLADFRTGERETQLVEANLTPKLPNHVEVDFFEPARIRMAVDKRERRQLPVNVEFSGSAPEGYRHYGHTVVPDTVLVEGPASELAEMTRVSTDPIRLDRARRPFETTVAGIPGSSHVRLVNPGALKVYVVIDELPVIQDFATVPVIWLGEEGQAALTPSVVTVSVEGPPGLLAQIGPGQIRAVARAADLTPGDAARRIGVSAELDLPADQFSRVRVKSVEPSQVLVRLDEGTENPA